MKISTRNKLLLILFLLFVLVSSFGITYSFVKIRMGGPIIITIGEPKESTSEEEKKESEASVRILDAKKRNGRVTIDYQSIMNDVAKNFKIVFTMEDEPGCVKGTTCKKVISGTGPGGIEFFNGIYDDDSFFTAEYLSSTYGIKFMQMVEGIDKKKYLVMMNYLYKDSTIREIKYYIFDSNFNLLNKNEPIVVALKGTNLEIKDDLKIWYRNSLLEDDSLEVRAKIENGKIYSLKHLHRGDCLGKVEDRVYSIDSGVIKYDVKRSFDVTNGSGMCS